MGALEGTSGGHEAALEIYTQIAAIHRKEKDHIKLGTALRNIGFAHRKLGNYDRSAAILKSALEMARITENRRLTVITLNDLAQLYSEIGNQDLSLQFDTTCQDTLKAIVNDLRSGKTRDSVTFDFHHLLRLRYANLLPYETDPFDGFYDQLVFQPTDISEKIDEPASP
jgi:tetratricopeptide (TPR) repeat protein